MRPVATLYLFNEILRNQRFLYFNDRHKQIWTRASKDEDLEANGLLEFVGGKLRE